MFIPTVPKRAITLALLKTPSDPCVVLSTTIIMTTGDSGSCKVSEGPEALNLNYRHQDTEAFAPPHTHPQAGDNTI